MKSATFQRRRNVSRETGSDPVSPRRLRPFFWGTLYVLVTTISFAPTLTFRAAPVRPGSIATRDVVAPRDLIVPDPEATARRKSEAGGEVLPVYDFDGAAPAKFEQELRESFARARAGLVSPEAAWGGLAQGLPRGLPEPGDRGLDRTATWGRTYWGGALFAFVADLEIRARTDNRRSLDDALKGILAAGGSIAVSWDLERALRAGDAATGVPVLAPLHARWGVEPVSVDLDAIWKRLGVVSRGAAVVFDDEAPLAGVRRSFTAARTPTP